MSVYGDKTSGSADYTSDYGTAFQFVCENKDQVYLSMHRHAYNKVCTHNRPRLCEVLTFVLV